jgi:hypothetical protein
MNIWNIVVALDIGYVERNYHLYCVRGDTLTFNFTVDNVDLTGWEIRAEVYDLNTAIRLCSSNVPQAQSNSGIIITSESAGLFTVTVPQGATATFQQYGQIEVTLTDPNGAKYTIFQQAITFQFERIIWNGVEQQVSEGDETNNPLF